MEQPIKQLLFEELQKRGVSVYRFARLTDIPEGRIKAWKRGEGNPKGPDEAKIREWISQKPTLSDQEQEGIPPMRYIEKLERMNEVLQESIQLSLNSILSGQENLREVLAKNAGRTDQRLDDMSEELHILSEAFQQFQDKGKPGSGSKSDKVKP
jgi:hypothetical protein